MQAVGYLCNQLESNCDITMQSVSITMQTARLQCKQRDCNSSSEITTQSVGLKCNQLNFNATSCIAKQQVRLYSNKLDCNASSEIVCEVEFPPWKEVAWYVNFWKWNVWMFPTNLEKTRSADCCGTRWNTLCRMR